MTTKRKQILKALAVAGSQIVDDLVDSTGLQRKNLQENLKATLEAGLIGRSYDHVTGLPAYRLTAKGRGWLESDKDDSTSKPPIPTRLTHKPRLRNEPNSSVTTQAGSGDITPAAAHCSTSLASATPGKGADVIEPPKPDEAPAAVCSDEKMQDQTVSLWSLLEERDRTIAAMRDLIASKDDEITELQKMLKGFGPGYRYAVMPDYPDIILHQTLASARAEAEETVGTEPGGPVHVVAIIDTAELAITWKRAA